MKEAIIHWRNQQSDFLKFLKDKGYSKSSLGHYRGCLDDLIRYANAVEATDYTPELGQSYLEAINRVEDFCNYTYQFKATVIRRFEQYLDGEKYEFARLRCMYICPDEFKDVLTQFLQYMEDIGYKPLTIKGYRCKLTKMLQYFSMNGVKRLEDIDALALQGAYKAEPNKKVFSICAKRFFDYLLDQGLINANYAGILPRLRVPYRTPSIYSMEEIGKVLSTVNRDTAFGKRDYAVLLLAFMLGIRAADISPLCFGDIDYEKKVISFVQYKTGVRQVLRLLPEIEEAIQDYLKNARPKSNDDHIFLTHRGTAFPSGSNVTSIVNKYFDAAKINYYGRHHGAHALRSTFASQLIEKNTPFPVVSKLLGHQGNDVISHYVELSTESLRKCALPAPVPTGKFLMYLEGKEF